MGLFSTQGVCMANDTERVLSLLDELGYGVADSSVLRLVSEACEIGNAGYADDRTASVIVNALKIVLEKTIAKPVYLAESTVVDLLTEAAERVNGYFDGGASLVNVSDRPADKAKFFPIVEGFMKVKRG